MERNNPKLAGKRRLNRKGNAAVCAILIMIMLLAIGTALLVVLGRTPITENTSMPDYNPAAESSSAAETEPLPELPPEPVALMRYPEKTFNFMKMDLSSVSSRYNVLLDVENNEMYTGRNISKQAYPASLTKIMTVIVALEKADDLSDTYKFTKDDMKKLEDENASVAGFQAGEKVTVRDLLYGAMLPSGADATIGLANYIAGSEDAFVDLMNEKVEELGLTGTHFENASGLHDPNHYTTALDMALIMKYALEDPDISHEFIRIISAKSYTTKKSNKHPDGITLNSIFFQRYDGFFIDRDLNDKADVEIIGGKTGFTNESKYSLASVYKIGEKYYVCITIKSDSAGKSTEDNIKICERYLPTDDLAMPENNDSSSAADDTSSITTVVLDESKVDATPAPIDQTETSSADDTSREGGEPQQVIPETDNTLGGPALDTGSDDNGDLTLEPAV